MNLITTTELRTKTSELVQALVNGEEVKLVHRSKIIATLKPERAKRLKQFDLKKVAKILKSLNHGISYSEGMKNYREHIIKKYGKSVS